MKRLAIPLLLIAACIAVLVPLTAEACTTRSQVEKRAFAKAHPCPATGKPVTSCPGYVIDHIKPLCSGAPDKAANMQWQTKAASLAKDTRERAYCRCIKTKGRKACKFEP